jgi:hypothetical protein
MRGVHLILRCCRFGVLHPEGFECIRRTLSLQKKGLFEVTVL